MFVLSVKTTGKQLCAVLCTAAVGLAILGVALFVPKTPTRATAAVVADTPQKQQAFLRSLGYVTSESPLSSEEIKIPENPRDATLVAYNGLQMQGGFNLGLYLGKSLKRFAWDVKTDDGTAYIAHLWLYQDKIVGGDLTDPATKKQKALTKIAREE